MHFAASAEAYDRYMGRFSVPLSPLVADFAAVEVGQRVLDVGCGPGALTTELVRRLGPGAVAAIDPVEHFVSAVATRLPGVRVVRAAAEDLPFDAGTFDATIAQLVVHFLDDPVAGIAEMARVTRPGGRVAACVWDFAGHRAPLSLFWEVARELDPDAVDEAGLPGAREGQLPALFRAAGLRDVEEAPLDFTVAHPSFDEWWEPFTLGVGPAGTYVGRLSADRVEALRERCRAALPGGAFSLPARSWAARGRA
jgi:SAM-dependent methyltransferase